MSRPDCTGVSIVTAPSLTPTVLESDSTPLVTCLTKIFFVDFVVASCLLFCVNVSVGFKL